MNAPGQPVPEVATYVTLPAPIAVSVAGAAVVDALVDPLGRYRCVGQRIDVALRASARCGPVAAMDAGSTRAASTG